MAKFSTFKLTDKGLDLEYKAQAGKTLKFTRFGLGDGDLGTTPIKELTALKNEILSRNITKSEKNNSKVTLGFVLDNKDITEGFYWREIGIFAEEPDTKEEILFMYANAGETADYIPAFSSNNMLEKYIDVDIYISDVENITATIDSSLTFASYKDLEKLNTTLNEALTEVSTKLNDTITEVNESLTNTTTQVENEITSLEQNLAPKPFSIETTAWVQNEATQLYEAIIEDNSITENDLADVVFDSTTYSIAEEAGIKGYAVEESGRIRLFAESVPSGLVSGKYVVNRGAANG